MGLQAIRQTTVVNLSEDLNSIKHKISTYDTSFLFLVSSRIVGSGIQFWKAETSYKSGDIIFYANKLFKVKTGFKSGLTFSLNNLELVITDHNSLEGLLGDSTFHLIEEKKLLLDNFTDINGKPLYKGNYIGNMTKDQCDRNNDGIVDVAETILGLEVSVNELNNT